MKLTHSTVEWIFVGFRDGFGLIMVLYLRPTSEPKPAMMVPPVMKLRDIFSVENRVPKAYPVTPLLFVCHSELLATEGDIASFIQDI